MAGATAIGGKGSYLAANAADWFGSKTDKDYGKDKPTATEGVHDAMEKMIGINSGIVGAAGASKAAPAAAAVYSIPRIRFYDYEYKAVFHRFAKARSLRFGLRIISPQPSPAT